MTGFTVTVAVVCCTQVVLIAGVSLLKYSISVHGNVILAGRFSLFM